MALSRLRGSMLWQLATIVLLILTEADSAYARKKKRIPPCFKGCALNDNGQWVCRNPEGEIVGCPRIPTFLNPNLDGFIFFPDAASAPGPVKVEEDYSVVDYDEYMLDIKDVLDEYEHVADDPGSDYPTASAPLAFESPMAASPYFADAQDYAFTPVPARAPPKSKPFLPSSRRCTRLVPPCIKGCRRGVCCDRGRERVRPCIRPRKAI
jgi:hypothetical protein